MVTHGSIFNPRKQHFSRRQRQTKHWMTDFYDDTILDYDMMVQRIVEHLKENDLFENTLIVITSDHGKQWRAIVRIPVFLLFPNQLYGGVRRNNVQRFDLSATILDYLGVDIPDWMEGESFLQREFKPTRPIFYANSSQWGPQDKGGWRNINSYKAPYYSLGGLGVIIAQRWHYLDLAKNKMESGDIKGHTAPATLRDIPQNEEIYQSLVNHLIKKRYPPPHAARE
jgi:arylsulfatase A-like enzyme